MSKYNLISFDMDGTLLNSQKVISENTIQSIKKATKLGKVVALGTGRCFSQLKPYLHQIPDVRYIICVSGACVYDLKENKTIYSNLLSVDTINALIKAVKDKDVMIEYLSDISVVQKDKCDVMEKYHMGVYKSFYQKQATLVEDIVDYYKSAPYPMEKFNVYHINTEERTKTKEELAKLNLDISMADAEITSIEISAKGVDKGTGLEKLCEYLNIPIEESITVGDADNDIGIFKKAGLKIAMGNANKNIKALSDVIVRDCDNDGCVQAIEEYLLK